MKIAIVGIRGIPIVYSGFETLAERLATDLVKRGHRVTVYCRRSYYTKPNKFYQGASLVYLPTLRNKYTETFIHSLLSTVHAIVSSRPDYIYYLGVGSAIFSFLPGLFGIKTVVNVDGLDWKREKWNFFGRLYLRLSEYLATIFPDKIVTDSQFIKIYYKRKYNKETYYLPYGYFDKGIKNSSILARHNLKKKSYFVWVGRLVPENHPEELIKAFIQTETPFKCMIIGDDYYEKIYKRRLQKLAEEDKRIIFTGFLNRNDCAYLMRNAFAYIETKRSGGTHPSLVEAMGFGKLIIAHDNQANRQILGHVAIFYQEDCLASKITQVTQPIFKRKIVKFSKEAGKRAIEYYTWPKIIQSYENLFTQLNRPQNHQN